MNNFNILENHVKSLIDKGQFAQAHQFIDQYQLSSGDTLSKVQYRTIGHLKAQVFIHQSKFSPALECLSSTQKKWGDNISLTADIACCHYQQGNIQQWNKYTKLTDQKIKKFSTKLNEKVDIDIKILLAKFYEEKGSVAKAHGLLLDCYSILENGNNLNQLYTCLSQLIRLQATHDLKTNLGQYYTQLIRLAKQDTSLYTHVEVQHSLMLAEISLVGITHAETRLCKLLDTPEIQPIDQNLLLYDFLEESIIRGETTTSKIMAKTNHFKPMDTYEDEILNMLIRGQNTLESIQHLNELASKMSVASYLRILKLHILLEKNENQELELKKKFFLILDSLDVKSINVWKRRLTQKQRQQPYLLKYNSKEYMLVFNNKCLSLQKRKALLDIFEILLSHPQISINSIIDKLWQVPFSLSRYKSIRMSVHRLNQLLFDLTGLEKSILIDKQSISFCSLIQINWS